VTWLLLTLISAFFLGVYDLAKKHALKENAVLPVLFFGIVTAACIWLPALLWSQLAPASFPLEQLRVQALAPHQHVLIFLKSVLVASSWIFGYFAIKHLPLSIAAPIRATSPLWTIFLAVFLLGEMPNGWQWVGIAIVLSSFYAFSLIGKLEGIRFHRNKWIACTLAATLIGSCSAIYDKFLLQTAALPPASVQAWFSIYLVFVMLPFYLLWKQGRWPRGEFHWRWSIPLIGIFLLIADFAYFNAVSQEGALISLISPIRRASVVVSFIGGIFLYNEKNFRIKALCVVALLIGISLIKLKA
jgi:transporter family protein